MSEPADAPSPATRIMEAWVRLEEGLRAALPVCSVQPPSQPTELLAALRINHRIGPGEESRILTLRATRNRAAHASDEPHPSEADRFEEAVADLLAGLGSEKQGDC